MGCIYRRKEHHCTTCSKRLAKTADRTACHSAGHTIEVRESPIYWVKYRRGGKSYAQSSESELKGEAKRLLQRLEGDIVRGKPITPKIGRLTFEQAAKDLLADYRANGMRSVDVAERRITKHLTPFFEGRRMADITPTDIRAYIVKRQADTIITRKAYINSDEEEVPAVTKRVSNAEINRELAALKRMFSLALEAETLLHRPKIPMLRESAPRSGFFEREQYEGALRHLPAEIRPVIAFAYITGWRITSEVLPLEWRRVNFETGEIRLDAGTTKNGEARTFPFTDDLRTLLKAQHTKSEELKKAGHIFPQVFFRMGLDDKPHPIVSFKAAWKNACRAAGCPGRIPHDLRRTAVRNLVRSGVPETVAMSLTGHKTRSVFDRYDITSGDDQRAAARLLNNHPSQRATGT